MLKRVLGIILIIIIILIGIGYCSGRKSTEKNESKIDLASVSTDLNGINNRLKADSNCILTVWENTINNKTINKREMATITNVAYEDFVTNTKEYTAENYMDGALAAKVESAYFNNVGEFSNIKESLNQIKTQLDDYINKQSTSYINTLNKYNKMEALLGLVSNPQGDFAKYKMQIDENLK